MATKTIVKMIDDIDGQEFSDGAGETVRFALDGVEYDIDLSEPNATELRKVLGRYVESGRRVGGRRRTGGHTKRVTTQVDTRAVREWADSQGIAVSSRGRVPQHVIDQYRAAGN